MGQGHMHHGDTMPQGQMGEAPASRPADTQPSQQLYACPMHAEVTSTNPADRCPKCGMKINKPVKGKTPGVATKPTATQGTAHESHGGHER